MFKSHHFPVQDARLHVDVALDDVIHHRPVQVRVLVGPPGEPFDRSVGQLVAKHPFAVQFDVHHEPDVSKIERAPLIIEPYSNIRCIFRH